MESCAKLGKSVGFCILGGRAEEPVALCDPAMSSASMHPALLGGGVFTTKIPPTCFLKTSNSEYTNLLDH